MRYKLILRWLGTDYCGWQVQPHVPTICGTVQDAVEKLFGERGTLTGCSRTDSGVHATGFVAALSCEGCHIPPKALQRALNVHLPKEIAVADCGMAEEEFHPRYDAVAKRYRYRWYQSEARDPFREGMAVINNVPFVLAGAFDDAVVSGSGCNLGIRLKDDVFFLKWSKRVVCNCVSYSV